jgi:nitroreductase
VTVLTADQFEHCVRLASRAPSPHNIQPARWRYERDRIELWEDGTRWLAASDPVGRDNRIALGMAWEGMSLALSEVGLHVELDPASEQGGAYPPEAPLRLVASGRLLPGAVADDLAAAVERRSSYRWTFAAVTESKAAELRACIEQHRAAAMALPAEAIDEVARLYDVAAAKGLENAACARELYEWMRFSPAHPRAQEDGLSADCMGLGRFEAWGAAVLLRPSVIRLLQAMRLTRMLVSERAKVRSAAAIVLVHKPREGSLFDAGRAWYRFWLALERAGLAAVPMSALVDDPATLNELGSRWPVVPASNVIVNVMRVGPRQKDMPMSSRLPPSRVLLRPRGA